MALVTSKETTLASLIIQSHKKLGIVVALKTALPTILKRVGCGAVY